MWRMARRVALALGLLAVLAVAAAAQAARDAWVIEPGPARDLLANGALLLDARDDGLRAALPVAGAVPVDWLMFAPPGRPGRGNLSADDAALTEVLRGLGVSADRPVVVVGDALRGWGEDGRIVWTLRSLGKEQSFLVNGGAPALLDDGPLAASGTGRGDFTVVRTDAYTISRDALRASLEKPGIVVLDAREPREYAGATPYGEARGGHVPGARSLYFRDLVGPDGRVLDGKDLRARLTALGVGPETTVVAYCSGGIRAAFVTAVLQDAGVDARNYAGSMWEWSAAPSADYPLETD